jgi:preprotein translocase subunit SecG
MQTVVLVIHLLLAIALVGVILLQRSEGGGLGIGGGGGAGGFLTARGSANLLTHTTAILAVAFIVTSLTLAILAGRARGPSAILESLPAGPAAPAPTEPAPTAPAVPAPPVAN